MPGGGDRFGFPGHNAVAVTAPEGLQDRLRGLTTCDLVNACARLRPGTNSEPVASATKKALRTPARRHQALTAEIADLDSELRRLCERANPALLGAFGVGVEVASSLLIAAGDNPDPMRSEASVAALCGTSPVEASSGARRRHRLNRGANRCANNALWRIAMIRLRVDHTSIDYAARRTAEGKTRREILRCPKRHIAREIYKLLNRPARSPPRSRPAPIPHPNRAHHPSRRRRPQHRAHPDIRTRKKPPPQPRPRPTLPTAPRPNPDSTDIGASLTVFSSRLLSGHIRPTGRCAPCRQQRADRSTATHHKGRSQVGSDPPRRQGPTIMSVPRSRF